MRNKNRENTRQRKNNNTHKTIFTWFGNLFTSTELQGFHYYQGRIQSTSCDYSFSFFTQKHDLQKTLITKLCFLHKSLLHGLSLNKFPIKNHTTLFGSNRVVKPDQTKLGSTKPNIDNVEYSKFSRVRQGRLMDQVMSVYIWIRLHYCWFFN